MIEGVEPSCWSVAYALVCSDGVIGTDVHKTMAVLVLLRLLLVDIHHCLGVFDFFIICIRLIGWYVYGLSFALF